MGVDQPLERRCGALGVLGQAFDRGALDVLLVGLEPGILLLAGVGRAAVGTVGARAARAGDRCVVRRGRGRLAAPFRG